MVVMALVTWPAGAQGGIPSGAFVKDAAGDVWLVFGSERLRVPIYPADEAAIVAIPDAGRWAVPAPDGSLTAGTRPEWAPVAQQPAPITVAAAPTATSVPPPPTETPIDPASLCGAVTLRLLRNTPDELKPAGNNLYRSQCERAARRHGVVGVACVQASWEAVLPSVGRPGATSNVTDDVDVLYRECIAR